jgi:uncharacterized protein YlzI (FlbEa/FlbD family)
MANKKKVTPTRKSLVKKTTKNSSKANRIASKSRRLTQKTQPITTPGAVSVVAVSSGNIVKMPRKRRSKNGTRMYFTQDTENAIVRYNKEQNLEVREKIFREEIYQSFQKLVENVFNTFKFSYFETGPQDVQRECLTHLVANMHKFDPNRKSKSDPKKKSKAYSYFSIIAKHYLILLNNTNYKKFNQNVEISEDRDENTIQLQQNDKYYVQQEMDDFIRLIVEFWEKNVDKIFTKQRDLNIANAVVNLFRNSDRIDAYNKKALYLYIREMASCKTQQITKVINRMKQYHDTIQRSYLEDGNIETDRYSNL